MNDCLFLWVSKYIHMLFCMMGAYVYVCECVFMITFATICIQCTNAKAASVLRSLEMFIVSLFGSSVQKRSTQEPQKCIQNSKTWNIHAAKWHKVNNTTATTTATATATAASIGISHVREITHQNLLNRSFSACTIKSCGHRCDSFICLPIGIEARTQHLSSVCICMCNISRAPCIIISNNSTQFVFEFFISFVRFAFATLQWL